MAQLRRCHLDPCEAIQPLKKQQQRFSYSRNQMLTTGSVTAAYFLLLLLAMHEFFTPVAAATVCYTAYSTSSTCDGSTSTSPFCRWCSTTGTCLQNTTTCLSSCGSTSDSAVCGCSSQCSWCSALDLCLPKTGSGSTCYASCNAASTAGSSFCNAASPTCSWCSTLGICNSAAQTCYANCTAAAVQGSTYCGYSQSACKWCSAIGICQAQSLTCYASCTASTTQGSGFCALTTSCSYCSTVGLCQAKTGSTCYSTCQATDSTSCAASTLCVYCSVMGICRAQGSSCYTSCQAATTEGTTLCSSTSNCKWCSAISVCQASSLACFTSCSATTATQDSTFCNFAQTCTYCTAIQLCQTNSSTCYATCQAASVDSTACDTSLSCKYCSILGVCRASAATCYTSCTAATTEGTTLCSGTSNCQWCSAISVCQPTTISCYPTCLAAAVNSTVCDASTTCQWCSGIGSCQAQTLSCYSWCPAATSQGSSFCTATRDCTWCAGINICQRINASLPCYGSCVMATANSTSCSQSTDCAWCSAIGVCRLKAETCYATCPASTVEGTTLCSNTTKCMWCPTSTSIGVCQSSSSTCWTSCVAASNDAAGSSVCNASASCKWCSLQYCTANNSTCHSDCDTIAADNPAICQVTPIQSACNWCQAVFSCYSKSSGIVCPSSCEAYIWKQSACESFSGCHWCPQHGGRCKPVEGRSQGAIGWAREIACDTGSYSSSTSATPLWSNTVSVSPTVTRTQHVSATATLLFSASPTEHLSKTDSKSPSRSGSSTMSVSASYSLTLSASTSFSSEGTVTNTLFPTFSMTFSTTASESFSRSPSHESSQSISPTLTETPSFSDSFELTDTTTIEKTVTQPRTPSRSSTPSSSASFSTSTTHSDSTSRTVSTTHSVSDSSTASDSPTITIDPCNTTFRSDSTAFVRDISIVNGVKYGTLNSTDATFLVINRVQLATIKTLYVQVGFNTYLRNFYYNTSMSWFPLPQVSNCIASGFELVNATDFIVRIDYNPDVSLSVGVNDDYFCNMTFSTDIFQCQLMTNFTFNFSAAILVTGTPQILSDAATAAVGVGSAILSLLSSGAALIQQARAQGLAQLASCQFSLVDPVSFQDGPLQLGFGSALQYYNRGCVVGNLILLFSIALGCVVLLGVVALVRRGEVAVYAGDVRRRLADDEDDDRDTPRDEDLPESQYEVPLQELLMKVELQQQQQQRESTTLAEGGVVDELETFAAAAAASSRSLTTSSSYVPPTLIASSSPLDTPANASKQHQEEGEKRQATSPPQNRGRSASPSSTPRSPKNIDSDVIITHEDILALQSSLTAHDVVVAPSDVHSNNMPPVSPPVLLLEVTEEPLPTRQDGDRMKPSGGDNVAIAQTDSPKNGSVTNRDFADSRSGDPRQQQPSPPLEKLVPSSSTTVHPVEAAATTTAAASAPHHQLPVGINQRESERYEKTFLLSRPETFTESFSRQCSVFGFPSIFSLPACLVFDSTVQYSVTLLFHPIDPNDTFIGATGIFVYSMLFLAVVIYTSRVTRKPGLKKVKLSHPFVGAAKWKMLRYIFLPVAEYHPRKRRDRRSQKMMSFILEDSRIPQYFCCDLALSALIAALAGVAISKREVCAKLAIAALAGNGLFVIVVFWLRPCITRYSLFLTAFTASLGLLSATFTFVSMETGALALGTFNQYAELLMLLTTGMGIVALIIAVVALARDRHRKAAKEKKEKRERGAAAANKDNDLEQELVEVTAESTITADSNATSSSSNTTTADQTREQRQKQQRNRQQQRSQRKWIRRIVRDPITGEEVDTSTSSSSSSSNDDGDGGNEDDEDAVYTLVDSEGNTTSDRARRERRRIAALERAAEKEKADFQEIVVFEDTESLPRRAVEEEEAEAFRLFDGASAEDLNHIHGSAEAYAMWRKMLERQRNADHEDNDETATKATRGVSYLSVLLMQDDEKDEDNEHHNEGAVEISEHRSPDVGETIGETHDELVTNNNNNDTQEEEALLDDLLPPPNALRPTTSFFRKGRDSERSDSTRTISRQTSAVEYEEEHSISTDVAVAVIPDNLL